MQRRTFITGLAGVAGAVAMPHVRQAGAQTPITLRLGHYSDVKHPAHIAAVQFADRVKERTNGAVQVNIFPNNALGSPPEILEQTKLGAIDMACLLYTSYRTADPLDSASSYKMLRVRKALR